MLKSMRITILGCGPSSKVPGVGNSWGTCDPNNLKNRRSRSSILVEIGEVRLLIDTTPDLIDQLNVIRAREVSAILYTHSHADHIAGFNDAKDLNRDPITGECGTLPIYADRKTFQVLFQQYAYLFVPKKYYWHAVYQPHLVVPGQSFTVNGIEVQPFAQRHTGDTDSVGYRIGDVAYSTDVEYLPPESLEVLKGVRVWIVDCQHLSQKHIGHATLSMVLNWAESIQPEMIILTHMSNKMDYSAVKAALPEGIEPAFDGMAIDIDPKGNLKIQDNYGQGQALRINLRRKDNDGQGR